MAERVYRVNIYGPDADWGRKKVKRYDEDKHPFYVNAPYRKGLNTCQRMMLKNSVMNLGRLVGQKGRIVLELRLDD